MRAIGEEADAEGRDTVRRDAERSLEVAISFSRGERLIIE
jgi:hypothetical protein